MKNLLECVWLLCSVVWILITDKEQARQYEYDCGCGEIDK